MNREQAKELLPIMKAFAEGKTILCRLCGSKCWTEVKSLSFSTDKLEYRIKPEPKYRPFASAKECFEEMQKHKPYGWVKDASQMYNITIIRDDGIIVNTSIGDVLYSFKSTFSLKFVDGTLFGIKEE